MVLACREPCEPVPLGPDVLQISELGGVRRGGGGRGVRPQERHSRRAGRRPGPLPVSQKQSICFAKRQEPD